MIAHFETSAVVPLVVEEPSLPACERLWNDATRAVSVRLLYAEARAALTMARRLGRLTQGRLGRAVGILDEIVDQIDHVEPTGELVRAAGELARPHGLRGYDGAPDRQSAATRAVGIGNGVDDLLRCVFLDVVAGFLEANHVCLRKLRLPPLENTAATERGVLHAPYEDDRFFAQG